MSGLLRRLGPFNAVMQVMLLVNATRGFARSTGVDEPRIRRRHDAGAFC